MSIDIKKLLVCSIAAIEFFCGCEAPHRNPLDPQNPHSTWGMLSGRVLSAADPLQTLAEANILFPSQNRMAVSDAYGQFSISYLRPQNGVLIVNKDGFLSDSILIDWNRGLQQQIDILLQPLPEISGKVQSLKSPPQPLADVKVTWQPGNIYTFTDSGGNYRFIKPAAGTGKLIFEKSGYKTLQQEIEFNGRDSITQDVFMNALPALSLYKVFSRVENYYGARRLYRLEIEAKVADAENDIEAVFVVAPFNSFRADLPYDLSTKTFRRTFSLNDLGLSSLEQCVGHDFLLYVRDQDGEDHLLGIERVERVILSEIELASPINGETVRTPFSLRWLPFAPGFPFTLSIEIYDNNDFAPQLIYNRAGISSDSLAHLITSDLPQGEYVWMVWCVDEFGNGSRSKPGSFSIAETP